MESVDFSSLFSEAGVIDLNKLEEKEKGKSSKKRKLYTDKDKAYDRFRELIAFRNGLLHRFDSRFESIKAKHQDWFLVRHGASIEIDISSMFWYRLQRTDKYLEHLPLALLKLRKELQEELDFILTQLSHECEIQQRFLKDVEFSVVETQIHMEIKPDAVLLRKSRREIAADKEFRQKLEHSASLKVAKEYDAPDYTVLRQWTAVTVK